jgi:biofilm PGA synthesis lipoprotein PgaB
MTSTQFAPRALLAIWLCVVSQCALANSWVDNTRAVILVYHHVDTTTPASTSVTPEVFTRHLQFLQQSDYQIIPLARVLAAAEDGERLPSNSVVLTFDDAYLSVYSQAMSQLMERRWPFTVFVTTDAVDAKQRNTMSWDQLREIEQNGGRIGNHSRTHAHLLERLAGESSIEWEGRVRKDILNAQARLESELDNPLRALAYPYGEFDSALEAIVEDLDFAALGQQSGPVGPSTDLRSIPRFPITSGYDDLSSLAEKLNSADLPVTVIQPASHVLSKDPAPPQLDLRIADGPFDIDQLTCYVSGQSPAQLTWLDREPNVVRIQAKQPLPVGRAKYTCTAPSAIQSGVYYWYSHLWMTTNLDGSWYSD